MLLSPYIDKEFKPLRSNLKKRPDLFLTGLSIIISFLAYRSGNISLTLILYTLVISAIPEEWFFRIYCQPRLIKYCSSFMTKRTGVIIGITLTSVLFSALHAIAQENIHQMYLIFIPSMIYGYAYHKTRDLLLIVNLHFISNIILYSVIPYKI